MKVLLIGTSTTPEDPSYGSLAGFNHGYELAFQELGHDVTSLAHRDARLAYHDRFDFFLLRDTTIDYRVVLELKERSKHFAMFTHSECYQAEKDATFIEKVQPERVFLDQPLGKETEFARLDIPMDFLMYGANPACYIAAEKDIDVLYIGHNHRSRRELNDKYILPMLDLKRNSLEREKSDIVVRIHGRGQPHGPLNMPDMFDALARAKVLVNLPGPGTQRLGYGGRRILDGMASGCCVVSSEFAKSSLYPHVILAPSPDTLEKTVRSMVAIQDSAREIGLCAYRWVRENKMIAHVVQKMLDLVIGGEEDG